MITFEEVLTKQQQKEFLNFPLKLYKGNPYFTPPLYMDEKKIFRKDFVYNDMCDSVHYNAYKDGQMVGRISGILQRAANEKTGKKQVRFTHFDVVEDEEVARALFNAVETWAISKGMDEVVGPLSYSDLEREGLLIEGFDYPATFEETYNYPYYQTFIERFGYKKDVDWTGSRIRIPKDYDGEVGKLANFVMKRYNLHIGPARNTNDFLKKYADGIFELLDKSYELLYGTVPFTDGMKKMVIDNFKLVIDVKYAATILDENDKMVCFGLAFPAIADAVRPSGGKLTPATLIRLLKALKKPDVIDLCLIGVDPEWLNRGVSIIISAELMKMLQNVKYAETNMNLEDNYAIQNQWKRFDEEKIKRHRCYVKELRVESWKLEVERWELSHALEGRNFINPMQAQRSFGEHKRQIYNMIKIIIDCFGGDHSPEANVDGALAAMAKMPDLYLILTGDETTLQNYLKGKTYDASRLEIVHAPEVIGCDERPIDVIRLKKESSMIKAVRLLRDQDDINAMVSTGSTGALVAAALTRIGRVKGVIRPAFCPILPTMDGGIVGICDSGANVEVTPEHLRQFAIMSSLYMEKVYGIEKPRVALLNVGKEAEKGDEIHQKAHILLSETPEVHFVGNMESRDLLSGNYDVVVCDGFSGNVLVKTTEGTALELLKKLKKDIYSRPIYKLGALLMKRMFMEEKEFMNYQNYGGSVLLGTSKTVVKGHGSSKATAVEKCIEQAYKMEVSSLSSKMEEIIMKYEHYEY